MRTFRNTYAGHLLQSARSSFPRDSRFIHGPSIGHRISEVQGTESQSSEGAGPTMVERLFMGEQFQVPCRRERDPGIS